MTEPVDAPSAPLRTLQEAGRFIGACCWIERRLFEVLGTWVTIERDPRAKLLFAEHSRHHGWHSELWTERLPVARGLDAAELVLAPSPQARALFDALAALQAPDGTVERLQVLYGVLLPRLVEEHRAALIAASTVTEAPTIRALTLIGRDDAADLEQGRALLDLVTGGLGAGVELGAALDARWADLDAGGGLLSRLDEPISRVGEG